MKENRNNRKKLAWSAAMLSAVVIVLPLFAAFEAHIVNVTAQIENALSVSAEQEGVNFGTVFPQEQIDKTFDIALSQSFQDEDRVDDISYEIRQKPKCGIPVVDSSLVDSSPTEYSGFVQVEEDSNGVFICPDGSVELPLLCPYISKHEITTDGSGDENDSDGINAFHGLPGPWTLDTTLNTAVGGNLVKSVGDLSDTWNLDLKVPCFFGQCAQDWDDFVTGINPDANPADYVANSDLEHETFGCDLWIEVNGVSQTEETQREEVGASLASYDAPNDCSATVSGGASLQSAISGSSDGATVCVDPSYTGAGDTFPVSIEVPNLNLMGLGSAGDAEIPGGIFVDNSGVTISGLEFTGYSYIQSSENAAIYIHNETGQGSGTPLTGTTISHNIFTAPGGAKGANANGVITEIGSAGTVIASGISILHNTFTDWRRGIFFNTANYEVAYNDFDGNDVGVANDGPNSSSIHNNDFTSNVLEAVGIAPGAIAGTSNDGLLTVNTNNFGPASLGNNVNWYAPSVLGGADVDATSNWWDSEAEADRTINTAEVDTSSPEGSAFPHS